MVQTAEDIRTILETHKKEIETFGVKRLRLFGSFAREEQKQDSDVDLLGSFDNFSLDVSFELEEYLKGLMGRTVQVIDENSVSEKFKNNIKMKRDKPLNEILDDILMQIQSIEKAVLNRAKLEIVGQEYYYSHVVKSLENIGEACSRIQKHYPDFFKTNDDRLGLRKLIDQRNRLSHGYDSVNHSLVESNVKDNLEMLKKNIEAVMAKENKKEQS